MGPSNIYVVVKHCNLNSCCLLVALTYFTLRPSYNDSIKYIDFERADKFVSAILASIGAV